MKEGESGSSLLETILALAIGVVAVGGLYIALSGALRSSGSTGESLIDSTILYSDVDTLRKNMLRVRPPYWDRDYTAMADAGSLRFPGLDGEPDKELVLRPEPDYLLLSAGESIAQLTAFPGCSLEAMRGDAGVVGARISWKGPAGEKLELSAFTGSYAFPDAGGK